MRWGGGVWRASSVQKRARAADAAQDWFPVEGPHGLRLALICFSVGALHVAVRDTRSVHSLSLAVVPRSPDKVSARPLPRRLVLRGMGGLVLACLQAMVAQGASNMWAFVKAVASGPARLSRLPRCLSSGLPSRCSRAREREDSSAGTFPSWTPTTRWIARGFRVDTPLHCPSGRTLRNLPHARAETAVHGGPQDARPPN